LAEAKKASTDSQKHRVVSQSEGGWKNPPLCKWYEKKGEKNEERAGPEEGRGFGKSRALDTSTQCLAQFPGGGGGGRGIRVKNEKTGVCKRKVAGSGVKKERHTISKIKRWDRGIELPKTAPGWNDWRKI